MLTLHGNSPIRAIYLREPFRAFSVFRGLTAFSRLKKQEYIAGTSIERGAETDGSLPNNGAALR